MSQSTLTGAGADLLLIYGYLRAARNAVTATSPSGDFDNTNVGSTAAAKTVTIQNYRATGVPYTVGLSGASTADYSFQQSTNSTCRSSNGIGQVPAATDVSTPGTCTINVTFSPVASTVQTPTRIASLDLVLQGPANSASSPDINPTPSPSSRSIALQGMALAPKISVATTPILFSAHRNFDSDVKCVTVTNTGNATLNLGITYSQPTSATPEYFIEPTMVNQCTNSMAPACLSNSSLATSAPNNVCQLVTRFTPKVEDARNGKVSISHNDTTVGVQDIDLQGTALPTPLPLIQLSPATLPFGQQKIGGSASPPQSLTIKNTDPLATLQWSTPTRFEIRDGTAPSNALSTEFTVVNDNCSAVPLLGPNGGQCVIGVKFQAPASASQGARMATLRVFSNNASNSPQSVLLTADAQTVPNPNVPPQAPFADTVAGIENPDTRIIPIENRRTNGLTYSVARTGVDASDFVVKFDACAGQIAANTTCNITLAFKPRLSAALGPRIASVQLTFAATGGDPAPSPNPVSVALSGVAIAPLSLSTSRISPTAPLTRSTTATVVLTNRGAAPITLGALAFQGSFAGDYALASTSQCMTGTSIAPGASCDLIVSFTPGGTATGSRAAQLQLTHDVIGSPQTLDLNGTATAMPQAKIGLDTQGLAFGDVALRGTSVKLMTVQNIGDAPLTFSAFMLGGVAASEYTRTGTCTTTLTLPINAQCTLDISFEPTQLGGRNASLTIQSDASNNPTTILLTGTGVPAPAPVITLSQPPGKTLDFLDQTVGGLYPPRRVTLTNTGTADLASIAIAVDGAVFTNVGSATCPARLAAGASCDIDIAFAPTAAGTNYAGILRITSNAVGSPHTVALAGRGTTTIVPVLTWSTPTTRLDFGLVTVGTVSATQSLTLANQGPSGVTLSVLNAIGIDGASFPVTSTGCAPGQTLFAGQSCNIDVRFAPPTAGAKTAVVQVASTGSAPADVVLAGTGLGGATPQLILSTTALNFGVRRVSTQSAPAEVVLSGNGSGAVVISAIAISGAYVVQNKTCPAAPFALLAGSQCTVTVTFVPGAEGAATGKLSITSDAVPKEREVSLSGQGEKPADLSSGGCSISGGAGSDPTLWALVLLAVAALYYRARVRRAAARRQP